MLLVPYNLLSNAIRLSPPNGLIELRSFPRGGITTQGSAEKCDIPSVHVVEPNSRLNC
jgi:hypothetical protein